MVVFSCKSYVQLDVAYDTLDCSICSVYVFLNLFRGGNGFSWMQNVDTMIY